MSKVLLKGGRVPTEEGASTAMDRLKNKIRPGNANPDFQPSENLTQTLSGRPDDTNSGLQLMGNNLEPLSGAPGGLKENWTVQDLIEKMKETQQTQG